MAFIKHLFTKCRCIDFFTPLEDDLRVAYNTAKSAKTRTCRMQTMPIHPGAVRAVKEGKYVEENTQA